MQCQFCGQDINIRAGAIKDGEVILCDWCGRRQEPATEEPPEHEQAPAPVMPFSGSASASTATPTTPPAAQQRPHIPNPVQIAEREAEIRATIKNAGEVIAQDKNLLVVVILLGLGALYSLYSIIANSSDGNSFLSICSSVLSFSAFLGVLTLRKWGYWLNMILCSLSVVWLILLIPVMLISNSFFGRIRFTGSTSDLVSNLAPSVYPIIGAIVITVVLLAMNVFILKTLSARQEKFA